MTTMAQVAGRFGEAWQTAREAGVGPDQREALASAVAKRLVERRAIPRERRHGSTFEYRRAKP